jgi:uncharacterized protein with HEPN domain
MQPESRKWLDDMRTAAGLVVEFSNSRTLADFRQDPMLRSAIYYQLFMWERH